GRPGAGDGHRMRRGSCAGAHPSLVGEPGIRPRCSVDDESPRRLDFSNVTRYALRVIQSFADKESELVWNRAHVRKFGSDLQRIANRKLLMLDAAETINDLRVPPGNRLEQLHGNRNGQHSIRI